MCVGLLLFEEEVFMSVPNAVNCKPGKASRHTAKQININKSPDVYETNAKAAVSVYRRWTMQIKVCMKCSW